MVRESCECFYSRVCIYELYWVSCFSKHMMDHIHICTFMPLKHPPLEISLQSDGK
jgi:hypothetical protein